MKYLFFFFIACCLSFSVFAQLWQPLGADNKYDVNYGGYDFGPIQGVYGFGDSLFLAMQRTESNTKEVIIKRFNGSGWDTLGAPFSVSSYTGMPPEECFITMDSNKTPYVFYSHDITSSVQKGSVKKYVAGSWVNVGSPDFTGAAKNLYITTDKYQVPYVLYTSNAGTPVVMKFDGTSWIMVGDTSFSIHLSTKPILRFDNLGTPYLAYTDNANFFSVILKKLSGNVWVSVGNLGSTITNGGNCFSIAFGPTNNPYLCYETYSSYVITVKKFDGSNWVTVGSGGVSPTGFAPDIIFRKDGIPFVNTIGINSSKIFWFDGTNWNNIALDSNFNSVKGFAFVSDTVLVVPARNSIKYDNKILIQKYVNNTWQNIGPYGFVPSTATNVSLAIDENETPYVAFDDGDSSGRLSVMKYVNTQWSYVGQPALSSEQALNITIKTGKNGALYVAYINSLPYGTQNLRVYYYDGTNWTHLDSNSLPPVTNNEYSFALDTSGIPYITYNDLILQKVVVKKYTGGYWVSLGIAASSSQASNIQLQFTSDNIPTLSYKITPNNNKLLQFINGNWQVVMPDPIETGSLTLAPNNTPYVVFSRYISGSSTSASRTDAAISLSNGNWNYVGGNSISGVLQPVSEGFINCSLVCDTANTPYVFSIIHKVPYIHGFSGSMWIKMNNPNNGWPSKATADSKSIAISKSNTLYVVYCSNTVYALKYHLPTSLQPPTSIAPLANTSQSLILYPNPTDGRNVYLKTNNLHEGTYTIDVYNTMGSNIYHTTKTITNRSNDLMFSFYTALTNGLYRIVLYNGKETYTASMLVSK